jgi:hypothetical protein
VTTGSARPATRPAAARSGSGEPALDGPVRLKSKAGAVLVVDDPAAVAALLKRGYTRA